MKNFESRRNSILQMEEEKEMNNISGIIKVLKFPLINQSLEINAHLGGVSKIFMNKSKNLMK